MRVNVKQFFGEFCTDSGKALHFFLDEIEPHLPKEERIILDFEGVRSLSSAFAFALVGNLAGSLSGEFFDLVRIVNANPKARAVLTVAIQSGLARGQKSAAM